MRWVVVLLVVALIAGVLSFTGIADAAVAKLLFVFFLVLFFLSLFAQLTRRGSGINRVVGGMSRERKTIACQGGMQTPQLTVRSGQSANTLATARRVFA
jgi:uncharacterized membrane protein YtjA (UPF0391 family)